MRVSSRKVTHCSSHDYLSLMFDFSSLTIGHLIGKGAFGFVYQGIAKNIKSEEKVTTVAIKTVRGRFVR